MSLSHSDQRIHKSTKRSNFTQISNEIINNPELTFKAKGILMYCLSKPPHWKLTLSDILSHCREKEGAIRTGMKELETHGYMHRYPLKDEKGKVQEWVIEVFENPDSKNCNLAEITPDGKNHDVEETPDSNYPDVENPDVGYRHVENRHHSNIELSNKEFNNTEESKTDHNHNHGTNRYEILMKLDEILQGLSIPKTLKIMLKIRMNQNRIKLSIEQILVLQEIFEYQKGIGNITSSDESEELETLTYAEFSQVIIKMLESVEDIKNMHGLAKTWVHNAISFKKDQAIGNEYDVSNLYNWLN